ncbi:MAG: ABC transporter substrate-binding protein [Oscillospiraceae bacterium]
MKSMFKKTAACALILTLILSMAACGKKETASEHQEGQVVVNIDWPVYVDPGVASKDADMMAAVNMYDSLTFPNNDGTISPLVAESWESDSEGKVYTFYLRDDVLFHSGNKLTAEDVKFTMDRMLTMGEGLAYLYHGVVSSTEVLDEHTVKFTLNEPSGTFPTALTRLYILDSALVKENIDPSGSYGEFGDYGKAWLTTNDAGSGPYKIKEMRTEEYVLMEQSDNYWKIDENAPRRQSLEEYHFYHEDHGFKRRT